MGDANLDERLDGPFGNVQERRSASHVSPLAHGRRGVNEKYYNGHAFKTRWKNECPDSGDRSTRAAGYVGGDAHDRSRDCRAGTDGRGNVGHTWTATAIFDGCLGNS